MEDISELTYRIHRHVIEISLELEEDKVYGYDELSNLVENSTDFAKAMRGVRCDTPIQYVYRKRFGYITVKKFLVRGQLVHYSMIENKNLDMSYLVHPDMADKALEVEKNQLDIQGKSSALVTKKEVQLPQLQIDLNSNEHYFW